MAGWAALVAWGVSETVNAVNNYYTAKRQAKEYDYLSGVAEQNRKQQVYLAGVEQLKGEEEAARRSKILAADVGSTYASWAANGLMVDKGSGDTLDNVLTSQEREAKADIDTIKDNAAINVWQRQVAAANYEAESKNYANASAHLKKLNKGTRDMLKWGAISQLTPWAGPATLIGTTVMNPTFQNMRYQINGVGNGADLSTGAQAVGAIAKSYSDNAQTTAYGSGNGSTRYGILRSVGTGKRSPYAWNTTGGFLSSNMA